MFFVFPDGGFSTLDEDLCKLPTDFRPPFVVAAEEGRLADELGREDCKMEIQDNLHWLAF